MKNIAMQEALESIEHPTYIDLDPVFNGSVDEDYDSWLGGVSRNRFLHVYTDWINFCNERREKVHFCNSKHSKRVLYLDLCFVLFIMFQPLAGNDMSFVTTLCFGLSLVTRRTLGQNARNFAMGLVTFSFIVQ